MTTLLTGATGFIGRHVLEGLPGGEEVVAIARRDPPPELAKRASWVQMDLAAGLDRAALPERIGTVVHLAQSERFRDFPAGATDVVALNVTAPAALLDYAVGAGATRFVLCSTGGVYQPHDEHVPEDHPVSPLNFYLASKYAAEVLLRPYRELMRTVILRPFFVYGPGQRGMLVAGLADRVLRGEQITVDGDPGLSINPTYVTDAARAVVAAMRLDGSGVVNVAGDETVTITELVERLAAIAGTPVDLAHRDTEPAGDLLGDNTRMKELLGVRPEVLLDEGLGAVVGELRGAGVA